MDNAQQEDVNQGDGKDDENSHREGSSDEDDDQEDCHDGKSDREHSLLDKNDILLKFEQLFRVREGLPPSVLVFDRTDVFQVLGTVYCNHIELRGTDELSPTFDVTFAFGKPKNVLLLTCLVKIEELVEAGVKVSNSDSFLSPIWSAVLSTASLLVPEVEVGVPGIESVGIVPLLGTPSAF